MTVKFAGFSFEKPKGVHSARLKISGEVVELGIPPLTLYVSDTKNKPTERDYTDLMILMDRAGLEELPAESEWTDRIREKIVSGIQKAYAALDEKEQRLYYPVLRLKEWVPANPGLDEEIRHRLAEQKRMMAEIWAGLGIKV